MKLDRVKITGLSAIALVGLGTGIGLGINGHSTAPAEPVMVKEVAATSTAKATTPAPSPIKRVVAPTVAVKQPVASAREVAPVTVPTSDTPVPAPVDTTPVADPTVPPTDPGYSVVSSIANGPGVTAPPAPTGNIVPVPKQANPPAPNPGETHS